MSDRGKYLRGAKWFELLRDEKGDLKDYIKNDEHKMVDVNFYLEEKAKKLPVKETKSKGRK